MLIWLLRKFNYVRELEAECQRLHDELLKALTGETTLRSLRMEDGGYTAEIGTKMVTHMAASFLAILDDKGDPATNYCEMTLHDEVGRVVIVTIQRGECKTPHSLRREAESKLAIANARIAELIDAKALDRNPSQPAEA